MSVRTEIAYRARIAARTLRIGAGVSIALLMLLPVAIVVVLSFSADPYLVFPPAEWGLRQYEAFLGSDEWLSAVGVSVTVALLSTVLSTVIGTLAAYAIARTDLPLKSALTSLGVAPLVLPGVAYAMALYVLYLRLDVVGSFTGVVLAYTALTLPFPMLIVTGALTRLPADLEVVSMSLGASRIRAMVGITLRLLAPAIGASMVFGFIYSFDEATLINFLGSGQIITLPKAIFDSVLTGIDPLIMAIAVILMCLTGLVMTVGVRLRQLDQGNTP